MSYFFAKIANDESIKSVGGTKEYSAQGVTVRFPDKPALFFDTSADFPKWYPNTIKILFKDAFEAVVWRVGDAPNPDKPRRGLANCSPEVRKRVATLGGKSLTSEHLKAIGKKGGDAVLAKHGTEFYSKLGKIGGAVISKDKEHMAEIGRRGGINRKRPC